MTGNVHVTSYDEKRSAYDEKRSAYDAIFSYDAPGMISSVDVMRVYLTCVSDVNIVTTFQQQEGKYVTYPSIIFKVHMNR